MDGYRANPRASADRSDTRRGAGSNVLGRFKLEIDRAAGKEDDAADRLL